MIYKAKDEVDRRDNKPLGFVAFTFPLAALTILSLIIGTVWANPCREVTAYPLAVLSDVGQGEVIPFHFIPVDNETTQKLPSVFLDVDKTRYGKDFQQSVQNAAYLGGKMAGGFCSAIVDVENPGEEMDGPSGGLLFTLAFYSMDKGRVLPLNEYAITGAVDKEGNVLPVGGIIEKLEAAEKKGRKKAIIPLTSRYDYILAHKLFPDMQIYYVSTAKEAIDVIEGRKNVKQSSEEAEHALFNVNLTLSLRANLTNYNNSVNFTPYYTSLEELYRENLDAVENELPPTAKAYYKAVLNRSEEVAQKGYMYAAANALFLTNGELMAMKEVFNALNKGELKDIQPNETTTYKKAATCISKVEELRKNVQISENNFEYIGGANLRLTRAETYLHRTVEEGENTLAWKVYTIYNYAEAYEWCEFSKQLYETAEKIKEANRGGQNKAGNTSSYAYSASSTSPSLPFPKELIKSWVVYHIDNITSNYVVNNEIKLDGEEKEFYLATLISLAHDDILTAAYYTAYLEADLNHCASMRNFSSFWGKVFHSSYVFFGSKNARYVECLAKNLEELKTIVDAAYYAYGGELTNSTVPSEKNRAKGSSLSNWPSEQSKKGSKANENKEGYNESVLWIILIILFVIAVVWAFWQKGSIYVGKSNKNLRPRQPYGKPYNKKGKKG